MKIKIHIKLTKIQNLSSNEEIFEKTKPSYRDGLNKSGFQEKLSYTSAKNDKNGNKQRKCKIIWYNPPHPVNIKTYW